MDAFTPDRRHFLAGAAALASWTGVTPADAQEREWLRPHGLSVFGDLAEKPDFRAFPYVRADAPKGGVYSTDVTGAFNSFNGYILKGDPAPELFLISDTLMAPSLSERDSMYPLVAESLAIAPDKSAIRFYLRKQARFHDGSPLTAKDVAFSLNILKAKGHPIIRQNLRDMESASAQDDYTLLVRFSPERSRDLPLIVARQPIFSEQYYKTHAFEEPTLDPPLGSGPYKIGKFEAGRFVTFDRVGDYWGADLPVNRGQFNFNNVRFDFFGDRNVAFEAFKAGAFNAREEFTSSTWARGYDFPAFREKKVLRREIPDHNISGVQGWFFNTRRKALKDRAFRQALSYVFDFRWTNENLMFNAYQRTQSYFENSEMKAQGVPQGAELALLEPWRGKVSNEIFGEAVTPPVSDGSGQDRALLRQAMELLKGAGFKQENGVLKDRDGASVELEFLDFSSALERHTQPYIKNLKLLGVEARMRVVDSAQFKRRVEDFDFDIISQRLAIAHSPGEELRTLFGSQVADVKGSRNVNGIKDPLVDALISKALVATTREELTHICRALDRVLRAGFYWTPHWFKASHWIAHWDCFGQPDVAPKYDPGMMTTWWWDEAKARAAGLQDR